MLFEDKDRKSYYPKLRLVMFKITKLPHVKADENGDYLAFAHAAFTVASRMEILLF